MHASGNRSFFVCVLLENSEGNEMVNTYLLNLSNACLAFNFVSKGVGRSISFIMILFNSLFQIDFLRI